MPPDNVSEIRPAGLLRRLASMLYDSLLLIAVLMAVTALVVLVNQGEIDYTHPLYRVLLVLVMFAFFTGFWTHGGQTLGMRSWRLQLQRRDGGTPTRAQCVVRFLAAIPSLLLFGTGFLWILVDRDHMAWHDRLSKTVVVLVPKQQKSK